MFHLVRNECHSVEDGWCGWNNISSNSWIRGKAKEMKTMELAVDDAINDAHWKNNTGRFMYLYFPSIYFKIVFVHCIGDVAD